MKNPCLRLTHGCDYAGCPAHKNCDGFIRSLTAAVQYPEIAKVLAAAVDRILLIFRFDDLRLQNHLTQNAMLLPTASK